MKEKLIAKFEQKDVLLHDAYQKPVTVWIDEETSMELNYQGWPTICRGDGDTLYVSSSIRRGHVDPYGATAFYVSHDRGKTWSEPRVINDTPADDRDTGVAYLGDGRIVVSFFTIGLNYFLPGGQWDVLMNYGDERQAAAKIKQGQALPEDDQYRNSGSYLIFSEDYGKTWSAPHKVPACDPHGPSIANDGSLLQCRANINTGCECYQSFDGGKTWESRFVIDLQNLPEGRTLYSEPYILQLKNGHYLLGIRGQNHSVKNSDHTLCVFLAHSDDGRTFTQPAPIPGVMRCGPLWWAAPYARWDRHLLRFTLPLAWSRTRRARPAR